MRRFQILCLMLLPYVVFGIIRVCYGLVVGDEGWYLLAIGHVIKGYKPYADFLYTQTPFLPYFYGAIMYVLGPSLEAARWLSFLLGFAAILMTMIACYRRAGIHGAVIAGLLLSLNLSFVFDVATLKSQALTVFLVAASVFLLSHGDTSVWRAIGTLFLMTLAVATRLSMAPALAILMIYLAIVYRKRLLPIAPMLVLNLLSIGAGAWYFYSGGNLLFGIYTFHREYYWGRHWSMVTVWEFVREVAKNQLPLWVCLAWSVQICIANRERHAKLLSQLKNGDSLLLFLALSYAATSLVHVVQIMPYATYQTSNIIFAVALCSIVLGRYLSRLPSASWGYAVLIPLVVLAMPAQEYQIVWSGNASLRGVELATNLIREKSGGKGPILTMATELAVETGLPLLPGYEMSEFCYFRNMPNERAAKLKVINLERFGADIESKAANVVCLTDREFEILLTAEDRKALGEILNQKYQAAGEIEGYGQFRQTLYVFIAK